MHSYILCLSQKSDLTLGNFSDVDLFEGAKTVNPFIDYVNINDNYSPKELANFIVNDIPFLKLEGEKVFLDKAKCEQYLDDTMTNLSVKIDDYFKRTNFYDMDDNLLNCEIEDWELEWNTLLNIYLADNVQIKGVKPCLS